jgi:CRISPR/Cas system endoribonuclease Cas6 (RAMP superfamily)
VGPWRAGRFSRAQGRRQPIEGVEGSVVIEGAGIGEVLPLLRAMERVGVGRKTSFGFGEIRVEARR